tara:strand:- start:1628 stop:2125 length:498 start_codon:yes stop_codon:yes gene_type:complete
MFSIDKINELNRSEFVATFGNIFEKTDWIANKTFEQKPFKDILDFVSKFTTIYENSSHEKILEILNSHPDLVVEKKLTKESQKEQDSANLNQCSEEEILEFTKLNKDYKIKFNFPFIIAVKGKNKNEILNIFKKRINNSTDQEFKEAKIQVKKIAIVRLDQILKN